MHAQLQRVILVHAAAMVSPALDECEHLYNECIADMCELLAPCFQRAGLSVTSFADRDVCIIVDAMLWELPVEALDVLAQAKTRTREFSMHMRHARVSSMGTGSQ